MFRHSVPRNEFRRQEVLEAMNSDRSLFINTERCEGERAQNKVTCDSVENLDMELVFHRQINKNNFSENFYFDLPADQFGVNNVPFVRVTVLGLVVAQVHELYYAHYGLVPPP